MHTGIEDGIDLGREFTKFNNLADNKRAYNTGSNNIREGGTVFY